MIKLFHRVLTKKYDLHYFSFFLCGRKTKQESSGILLRNKTRNHCLYCI